MFAKICTPIGPGVGEGKKLNTGTKPWFGTESGPKNLPFHVRIEAKEDIHKY